MPRQNYNTLDIFLSSTRQKKYQNEQICRVVESGKGARGKTYTEVCLRLANGMDEPLTLRELRLSVLRI